MSSLEIIAGIYDFVREKVVVDRKLYKEVSEALQKLYPGHFDLVKEASDPFARKMRYMQRLDCLKMNLKEYSTQLCHRYSVWLHCKLCDAL